MASTPGNFHFLDDISVKKNSPGYQEMLNSPVLGSLLELKALEVVRLYQARVGKKTGKLAASAEGFTRAGGGHKRDRLVGVVTVADETVASTWKGKPFYYGEYHEEGTLNSKRASRRKGASRLPRRGYHELRQVAQEWRSAP